MVLRKESLRKRLEKLHEYRRDLSEIAGSALKNYVSDKRTKCSGERVLFLMCENVLDFLDHVLAREYLNLDDALIHKHIQGMHAFIGAIIKEFEKYLRETG